MSATAPPKPSAQTQQVLTTMEENSGQVKSMLEQIIKRLDNQATIGNQRHEDQSKFNADFAKGLQNMRQQLDLTQKEVDETRKAAATPPHPSVTLLSDPLSAGVARRRRRHVWRTTTLH